MPTTVPTQGSRGPAARATDDAPLSVTDRVARRDDLVERLGGPVPLRNRVPEPFAFRLDVAQERLLVDANGATVFHQRLAVDHHRLDVASAAALDERLD